MDAGLKNFLITCLVMILIAGGGFWLIGVLGFPAILGQIWLFVCVLVAVIMAIRLLRAA